MTINIALFLDGRPGHEKQSQALVKALGELREVRTTEISLTKKSVVGRIIEYWRIRYDKGGDVQLPSAVEMLIGTGSRTHLPLIGCRQRRGLPAITCMAPELYLRPWFDLCCVPRHDGLAEGGNILLTDGPPVLPGPFRNRQPERGVVLVGGLDKKSHFWNDRRIVDDIVRIVEGNPQITWTISSSPRTPDTTVRLLVELAGRLANATFFHYADTERGWVEEQYAESTFALVSADSISMMYEAITAGCRVGIIPVQWRDPENKFQRSIDYLAGRGLVSTLVASTTSLPPARNQDGDFNEAKRCAQEIVKRFCPEGLLVKGA